MKNCAVPQEYILKILLLPALIPVIRPIVQNTFPHPAVTGSFGTTEHLTVFGGCVFSSLSLQRSVLGF